MFSIRRFFVAPAAAGFLALGGLLGSAVGVGAYGNDAVYQLTFSLNCDNPSVPLCAAPPVGFGLGGTWGWIELDNDGTYNATATFCAHQTVGLPNGAFHINVTDAFHAPWTTMTQAQVDAAGIFKIFPVGTDPGGMYLVPLGSGLAFPQTPGHYSFGGVPGVTGQSQVTKV